MLATPARAQSGAAREEAPINRRWTLELSPYFWLAALDGDATVRGFETEVDQSLGDAWDTLVDNFNFAAAFHVELHNGQWGVFGDVLYMNLQSEGRGPVTRQEIDGEVEQFVGELGAFYRLVGADPSSEHALQPKLDVLGGARVNYLKLELDPTLGATREGSQTWIDPFVGLRGEVKPTDWLAVFARGDVGGFGIDSGTTSELAWNVTTGLRFDLSPRTSLSIGYRWFHNDFEEDDDDFEYDILASGPFVAFTIRF